MKLNRYNALLIRTGIEKAKFDIKILNLASAPELAPYKDLLNEVFSVYIQPPTNRIAAMAYHRTVSKELEKTREMVREVRRIVEENS